MDIIYEAAIRSFCLELLYGARGGFNGFNSGPGQRIARQLNVSSCFRSISVLTCGRGRMDCSAKWCHLMFPHLSLNFPWTFLNLPRMCPGFSLNVPWTFLKFSRMFPEHSLSVPWTLPEGPLNAPSMFPQCSTVFDRTFPQCSPNVPECSPIVPWTFSEYFLKIPRSFP
jgi:hypothetical protein